MRTLRRIIGVSIPALSLIVAGAVSDAGAGVASADPVSAPLCATSGTSLHGHYSDLTGCGASAVRLPPMVSLVGGLVPHGAPCT